VPKNPAININKYLRDQGHATRRGAEALVRAGKVLVNGQPAVLGQLIKPEDKVELVGLKPQNHTYLAYYKPRGLPTQAQAGEESVISQWRGKGLFPIGRLDKESEGLLILTSDGRITERLLGGRKEWAKEYLVETAEKLRPGLVAIFKKGMSTKALGQLLPAEAKIVSPRTLRLCLQEGKRHQVRVMLAELGLTVRNLKRVKIGRVSLGNLTPGNTRPLSAEIFCLTFKTK
jgi:23S rRNA pseudouridine2604 synthase